LLTLPRALIAKTAPPWRSSDLPVAASSTKPNRPRVSNASAPSDVRRSGRLAKRTMRPALVTL
jgi:hypothetical protein